MGSIAATALTWSIKGLRLVDGIDLYAAPGQVVGLIGPNGSGKTSFLRVLAGVRTPESGTVELDDVDTSALRRKDIARRLAIVEQDTSAHMDLTVRQVVEIGRTPFRGAFDALTEQDERIIADALDQVDIGDLQHRSWQSLSGGERQRAQLARALAQQPQEILLDEPTNHLDIRHQLELLELLRSIEATCVIALHDLNLAACYCDRLVVLDRGRVVAAGAPGHVLTPELIRDVYHVDVAIDRDPRSGRVRVTYQRPVPTPAP